MANSAPDIEGSPQASLATATHHGDFPAAVYRPGSKDEKSIGLTKQGAVVDDGEESIGESPIKPTYDHTRRTLKPRHIQLIGIGGTVGTALYVQIGQTLLKGGPGSLFIAFSLW